MGVTKEKRSERLDIRVTPTEKKQIQEVARKERRTVISLFMEWLKILAKDR